jgi:hypothetical protein
MTVQSSTLTGSLARPNFLSALRALWAVMKREWTIFVRYPSWVIALFIWPIIFPLSYVLTAQALSGRDGSGMAQFQAVTGVQDYIGYIAVGTIIWMWQNVVLWNVGFALRNEQLRGTLESNWLSPTWRFAYLLGSSAPQLLSMLMFLTVSAIEFVLFLGVQFQGSLWLTLLTILVAIPSVYGLGFAFASLVITLKEAMPLYFSWDRDDLLWDYLPGQRPAGLDAPRCSLAAADLHHPRGPLRFALQRRLARHPRRSQSPGVVRGLLADGRLPGLQLDGAPPRRTGAIGQYEYGIKLPALPAKLGLTCAHSL